MGRTPDAINAKTQYHQGLQSQETIDDAPPHDDDLYEPPPDYQKKPKKSLVTDNIKSRPNEAQQTQTFPPRHDQDDENATQSFPPKQHDHISNEHDDYLNQTQQFPPRPDQTIPSVGVQFPHHHQPAGGIPVQPGMGGIPVQPGMPSPSPIFMQNQLQVTHQPWKTHLFDCMSDPQNAIITACCPCVTFGQIAEIVDSGSTSCGTSGTVYSLIACCVGMPCLMSCGYRSKMRARFGLVESPAPDCLVHCFCEWCALCQEYRELQLRGLDPAIGWMGNVAKQRQQMQQMQQFGMAPPMQQRMM